MGAHQTVAALAGQLAEYRTKLAAFEARLSAETGPVMVLQAEVKKLRAQVEELAAKLDAQAEQGAPGEGPSAPRWDNLTPEETKQQLAELQAWVEDILRREFPGYLKSVAKCWPNHREAWWEFGTLRAEWYRVYPAADDDGGKAPLVDAQWFLERWLPGAVRRVAEAMSCDSAGCKLVRKRTQQPPAGTAPGVAWQDIAAQSRQASDRLQGLSYDRRQRRD